jgi:hypothetical protein
MEQIPPRRLFILVNDLSMLTSKICNMKPSALIAAGFIFLWISSFNGCSKDPLVDPIRSEIPPGPPPDPPPGPPPVITQSFTQEFDTSFSRLQSKGWVFADYSSPFSGGWVQGQHNDSKINIDPDLSPAYSFTVSIMEFAYAGFFIQPSPVPVNSWMFSPPVTLKNGDKFSFFTKGDSLGINRLEIRLNETDTTSAVGSQAGDIGKFTKLVGSVNPSSVINGYPKRWTKFEYTVIGLQDSITSRIAFRYYVTNPKSQGAIGIDLLQYQKL